MREKKISYSVRVLYAFEFLHTILGLELFKKPTLIARTLVRSKPHYFKNISFRTIINSTGNFYETISIKLALTMTRFAASQFSYAIIKSSIAEHGTRDFTKNNRAVIK